jgi:hypothetical protein
MFALFVATSTLLCADPPDTAPTKAGVAPQPTAADQLLANRWLSDRHKIVSGEVLVDPFRLEAAKAGDLPAPYLQFSRVPGEPSLVAGDIGTLYFYRFRVLQRISDSEARVSIHRRPTLQEVLGRSYHNDGEFPEIDVFLAHFDFAGIADDREYKTKRCFLVKGTKTYNAVLGGIRTVFVIEPYDSTAAEAIVRKAVKQEVDTTKQIEADRELKRARLIQDAERAKMERHRQAETKKYPALVKNARALIKAGLYDAAEKMLNRVIAEAPGTEAAKDAQKELEAMPHH